MMQDFLTNNRGELVARCKAKVAQRPRRAATEEQLKNGIPLFLEQLICTLHAEQEGRHVESVRISGGSGGDIAALSEIGASAAVHGKELLKLGFTVDQVVHDYGDLCQAITELAFERDAPFAVDEFRTLNRCLDNAIADAVSEFSLLRDATIAERQLSEENARVGFLVHELRNSLATATLSARALEIGGLTMVGATGGVLKRSLAALGHLIDRALDDVRLRAGQEAQYQVFSLADFMSDAKAAAELDEKAGRSVFTVAPVERRLAIKGDRELLLAALANLVQNAFKFTKPGTGVVLSAYAFRGHVLIDVMDHCGGLPSGFADKMFTPFSQRSDDKTGLGLGLAIARQTVEREGGTLTVRDAPGAGCTFTIALPRHEVE